MIELYYTYIQQVLKGCLKYVNLKNELPPGDIAVKRRPIKYNNYNYIKKSYPSKIFTSKTRTIKVPGAYKYDRALLHVLRGLRSDELYFSDIFNLASVWKWLENDPGCGTVSKEVYYNRSTGNNVISSEIMCVTFSLARFSLVLFWFHGVCEWTVLRVLNGMLAVRNWFVNCGFL